MGDLILFVSSENVYSSNEGDNKSCIVIKDPDGLLKALQEATPFEGTKGIEVDPVEETKVKE